MAVVINVAAGDAHGAEVVRPLHESMLAKGAISIIQQKHAVAEFVGDIKIGPAVVVDIEPDSTENRARTPGRAAFFGDVLELPVAQVAPKLVAAFVATVAIQPRLLFALAWPGHIKVYKAVLVVV